MIEIIDLKNTAPYKIFQKFYNRAIQKQQKSIEAISISSFNKLTNEVESRFVNLKYIIKEDWIFFTNYNSRKGNDFKTHSQISGLFYWDSINLQIRIKGNLKKTNPKISDEHFRTRSREKNALAISSCQSKLISSYDEVILNYEKVLKNKNKLKRPTDWGGYYFRPYYFEFWEGNNARVNKRVVFENKKNKWQEYFLQP